MSDAYVVAVEGLDSIGDIRNLPVAILTKARQAINKTLTHARTQASREIRKQVNFPARYLSGTDARLTAHPAMTGGTLEAKLRGRNRPTSLARFVTNASASAVRKKGGATLKVNPGRSTFIPKAFLMKLRQGTTMTDTQHNLGLAIRLKPGESVRNKKYMVDVGNGLYLLYGPSVNQVFRTVSEDIAPDTANFLEREFSRLMSMT